MNLRRRTDMSLQTTDSVCLPTPALERAIASGWNPVCHITYNCNTWVKLLQPPSDYGFDEAKLLCQEYPNTWVAWVPDHGEVMLDRSHFYCSIPNGTKKSYKLCPNWFPAWRLGTHSRRLRLQWLDQRQQPSWNTFPVFRLLTR
jgi:hypothetical protein